MNPLITAHQVFVSKCGEIAFREFILNFKFASIFSPTGVFAKSVPVYAVITVTHLKIFF